MCCDGQVDENRTGITGTSTRLINHFIDSIGLYAIQIIGHLVYKHDRLAS